MSSLLELPPLSLYIHIPWCLRKCPYCDFNSHACSAGEIPEADYVRCLLDDLQEELQYVQGRSLQSVFFGGGTPSIFSSAAINNILQGVEKHIPFSEDIEITLEANPGTVEQGKFLGFYQAGINRLSIGIQSFDDLQLQQLGRVHSSNEARKAVNSAQRAGFSNINLDLMHGLPGQSSAEAKNDLQQAIDLGPSHLSWYQLTIEKNTAFYQHPPTLPAESKLVEIQDSGEQLLSAHGFVQYEVSAYNRSQSSSLHNLNYWQFGDYLGIGAGAHGKVTQVSTGRIMRRHKTRSPKDYLDKEKPYLTAENRVPIDELALEFMMNALRLCNGVDTSLFSTRTGLPLTEFEATISHLQHQGLLSNNPQRLQTTERGQRFLNEVIGAFL